MDKMCQPENCHRTKSMLSIIVDDFDSKLEKEHAEKEKTSPEHVQNNESKVKRQQDVKKLEGGGTPDNSIKKILDEVEHRKDEFRKLLDEHNAVIQNLKKIEKLDDTNLQDANSNKTPIPTCI